MVTPLTATNRQRAASTVGQVTDRLQLDTSRSFALSLYEQIPVLHRIPYYFAWPALSLLVWLGFSVLVEIYDEDRFLWTEAALIGGAFYGPVGIAFLTRDFQKSLSELSVFAWDAFDESHRWLDDRLDRIFGMRNATGLATVVLVVVLGVTTVLTIGAPYDSVLVNSVAIVCFALLLIVCGHAAHVALQLMLTLREITELPLRIPFYFIPHPALDRLYGYYSRVALWITAGYVVLALVTWQGPYGLNTLMVLWLTILAAYPVSLLVFSTSQIHRVLRRLKYEQIRPINEEVQRWRTKALAASSSSEDIHRLQAVMAVQASIEDMREWPLTIPIATTTIITIAAFVAQTFVAVAQFVD